jgi:hypothetical protein
MPNFILSEKFEGHFQGMRCSSSLHKHVQMVICKGLTQNQTQSKSLKNKTALVLILFCSECIKSQLSPPISTLA